MPASNFMPAYDHIVVVVEENHSFGEIVGNPQAPYINSLAAGGALLTNYHAITHPSQPNYLALYSGNTFGVADNNDHNLPDPTLATVLQTAGRSFFGYIEPASPRKHDPWRSFPEGTTTGPSRRRITGSRRTSMLTRNGQSRTVRC
jgi:acid phosphatase